MFLFHLSCQLATVLPFNRRCVWFMSLWWCAWAQAQFYICFLLLSRAAAVFNYLICLAIVKGKGSFYIAQYPVHWTAQSALHFLPSLTDLFIPTPFSASPGSILARQQLRAKTKSLTFPPLSIARYSFIQLSQQGRQWREGKCPIFQTVPKGDSNPGSHDCESGILPLSYRAPLS